jgi:hypothetical protein
MLLDGNKANNGTKTIKGVYFNNGTALRIKDIVVTNMTSHGVQFNGTTNSRIQGSTFTACGGNGLYLYGAVNCKFIENESYLNTLNGIAINSTSSYNAFDCNIEYQNGLNGLLLGDTSSSNNVLGNISKENSQTTHNTSSGICITDSASYNNVQTNISRRGSLSNQQKFGITINNSLCTGNLVTNNDLYTGGATSSFYDGGTSTVTTSANRL